MRGGDESVKLLRMMHQEMISKPRKKKASHPNRHEAVDPSKGLDESILELLAGGKGGTADVPVNSIIDEAALSTTSQLKTSSRPAINSRKM